MLMYGHQERVTLSKICNRYKKVGAIQNDMFGLCPIQKMVQLKKISLQIMIGLHTNNDVTFL
jgi:hypothetical protein